MGIDEEISFIQASLKTLRFDYDLFFSGAAKFPPFKLRTELEKRVRKLGNEPMDKLAQRFKMQSVLTTYNSYIALWEKQMKLRESGIRDPRLAAAVRSGMKELKALDSGKVAEETPPAAEAEAAASAPAGKGKPAGEAPKAAAAAGKGGTSFKIGARAQGAAAAAPPAGSPFAKLFDEYAQLKKQTGEKVGYDLEKFSAMMEKKKAELQAKGLKQVNFGVHVKDGKVILKAKSQSG